MRMVFNKKKLYLNFDKLIDLFHLYRHSITIQFISSFVLGLDSPWTNSWTSVLVSVDNNLDIDTDYYSPYITVHVQEDMSNNMSTDCPGQVRTNL